MIRTVVVYQGKSDFGSVNGMAAALAAGFERLGWRVAIIDLRRPDCVPAIVAEVRSGNVGLFLSVNGFGIPDGPQVGFYGETEAPAVVYFVDHPVYHHPTINNRLPHFRATFTTAHHVDFCRRYIRDDVPLAHIPHGGHEPAAGHLRPWAERDIDVLVSASLAGLPEALRAGWAEEYGAGVAARLEAILEIQRAGPARPLHLAVAEGLGGDEALTADDIYPYFAVVDTYLRAEIKLGAVRALAGRGLRIAVRGPGWPDLPGIDQAGATPVAEVSALMGRARIVLNPFPVYHESHERPIQAALHGAVAAGLHSPWVDEALAGAALALPDDAGTAAERLVEALADPDLGERAARGRAIALANHTWAHRAATLAEFAARA